MENYEIHVTVPWSPTKVAAYTKLGEELGWHTSWIDGDPLLGQKRHFYFTRHEQTYSKSMWIMEKLVWLLDQDGPVVLRRKVEQVVFDERP